LIIYDFTFISILFHSHGDGIIAGEELQNLDNLLSAQGLWAGKNLFRVTPALAWDFWFQISSEGHPHSFASYNTQENEMAKIQKSDLSQNTSRKYKSEK
jgi:hypothetical protein